MSATSPAWRRHGRLLGVVATSAVLASTHALSAQDGSGVCDGRGEQVFIDTTASPHQRNIACAAGYELVEGYVDGSFNPEGTLTRAAMATLVADLVKVSGDALPSDGRDRFSDDDGSVHEHNIEALADNAVVVGEAPGRYAPAHPVSRAQMATFIANAYRYATGEQLPAPSRDHFSDDDGSVHEDSINRVAEAGIARGTAGGVFSASAALTRAQAATFALRTAAVLDVFRQWAPGAAG